MCHNNSPRQVHVSKNDVEADRHWTQNEQDPCLKLSFFIFFKSIQLLSHVRLFATPWTATRQASLCITNSWSLLKLTSIESVMPSNYLILCCPLLLLPPIIPSIRVFSKESVASGGQRIGALALASVLPMNIQD